MPRSGKTYIAAGVIRDIKPSRAIIITTRPTETMRQWRAVFAHHAEFTNYKILYCDAYLDNNELWMTNNIIVLASAHISRLISINLQQQNPHFDIAILDEMHAGGCTDLMNSVLHCATIPIRIMLTATYMRPVVLQYS